MPRTAFNDKWSFRPKVSAFSELGGAPKTEWHDVVLPHDALIGTARNPGLPDGSTTGFFEGGFYEYRRTYRPSDEDAGALIVLEFDGVYRGAMVYVNGALAGQHAYGYSRFTVRIDPYLCFGEDNEIRVECHAHEDSRWYSGAGIYRDVHLIVKPPTHLGVDGIRVTTPDVDAECALVEVTAVVRNLALTTTTPMLRATLTDRRGRTAASAQSPVTLLPSDEAQARLRLWIDAPDLWSTGDPALYEVVVELTDGDVMLDREKVRTGLRTLSLDPRRGLRINGEPVKLRGACVHHDNGPLGAATIPRAEHRRVQILKQAGFNAIRSSHHPLSSAMLDACDELGMLVMDETFDMWTSSKRNDDYASHFNEWWERDVAAMVVKDVNHPSVIMYSIGNEIPETGDRFGAVWGRRLAEKLRGLDPTRFVTNGINPMLAVLDEVLAGMRARASAAEDQSGINTMMSQMTDLMAAIARSDSVTRRTEESFAVLDVAGLNYGDGRYEIDHELFPDRILVGTETFPGNIDRNWALVTGADQIIGDFTWTGWDYLGEAGIGGIQYTDADAPIAGGVARDYPWLTAFVGDVDITGNRRPASYYREVVFGLRQEPYIAVRRPEHHGRTPVATPWAWSDAVSSWSWSGYEGRSVHVEVYCDAQEVELVLNDAVIGRARVGAEKAFRADFEITYQPGTLVARALDNGMVTGQERLISAGQDERLRAVADRDRITCDTGDLAFVDLSITDDDDIVKVGCDRTVHVQVDGPVVLQGLANANPQCEEAFAGDTITTFDGRALAVVRPIATGTATVRVSAEGLDATNCVIDVVSAPTADGARTWQTNTHVQRGTR